MSWNNEQQREFSTQHSYAGYTGSSEQSSQMFEQPSQYQQQTFHQPETQSTHTYGQTPYGYPPSFAPVPSLEGTRLAAALSYGLGWFSGLLFLLFGGENRYIRFHALQSIAFFGAINLINVGVFASWITARSFHGHWLLLLSFLFLAFVNLIALVGWFVAIIQAARGVYYKLPFVGNAIAQHVHGNPTLK